MHINLLWALLALPAIQARISRDGSCGGNNRNTCLGSQFGNCCSRYHYCGSTKAYCGDGCNPLWGSCQIAAPSSIRNPAVPASASSIPIPASSSPAAQRISTNGRCGAAYNAFPVGMTCKGSKYGNCCSQYSYCGSTQDYCGSTCQSGFGTCSSVASSSLPVSSASRPGASSSAAVVASSSAAVVASSSAAVVASSSAAVVASSSAPVIASSSAPMVSSSPEPVIASSSAPMVSSSPEAVAVSSSAPIIASSSAPIISSSPEPIVASSSAPTPDATPTPTPPPLPICPGQLAANPDFEDGQSPWITGSSGSSYNYAVSFPFRPAATTTRGTRPSPPCPSAPAGPTSSSANPSPRPSPSPSTSLFGPPRLRRLHRLPLLGWRRVFFGNTRAITPAEGLGAVVGWTAAKIPAGTSDLSFGGTQGAPVGQEVGVEWDWGRE
ncbi:hypothetical protein BDU57DRAFT_531232 [Ampelomyces quisqualis]|uniref:Chitin-binding type-1 domain-containing protein n=1 Tax=Ampelomyces quisqualis TaxID=50730 RepID=A0A6A5QJF5_AMPQU|nr:hypothetical protein BDU57DRAFT_531232 [Ampelomyces quisqualis]